MYKLKDVSGYRCAYGISCAPKSTNYPMDDGTVLSI